MIGIEEVLRIHSLMVGEFGGADGLRDAGALEAALGRPWSTFGGQELMPRAEEKAAAILESILINHPFIDGNKRTGYVLMRLILLGAGLDLAASQKEKYDLVVGVAAGQIRFDGILAWIEGIRKKADG